MLTIQTPAPPMSIHKSLKKQKTEDPPRPIGPSIRTCASCHRDISNEIYVKCARCAGFNQCLECFSVGAECQAHLRSHPFLLLEPILQPIFQRGWTSEQEILLLNAIQTCGLGNWHEIADVMKTKTALECECHYFGTYIDSDIAPMPNDSVLPEVVLPPPPPFDTSPRESRPSIAHERNLAERNKKDRTTPAEFAGWMPRRLEFEVEYLNDAEQIVSGIGFADGEETATTLAQKLASLRAYNEKLEERYKRTTFAVEWDLLDHDFRSFGGRTKSEREIEENLLPLAQVVPRDTLTKFVHALQNEMRLKDEIELYKKWRRNGIVNRDEGILFNQLEGLMSDEKLSPGAVEKWNRDVATYAESAEFRATLDRQLLGPAENRICEAFGLSPHNYLRIKDLLIREFAVRGEMTRELAVSFMPGHEQVVLAIYEGLRAIGVFAGAERGRGEEEEETEEQQPQQLPEEDDRQQTEDPEPTDADFEQGE
jgi:transcriptional adapter 2-alpha